MSTRNHDRGPNGAAISLSTTKELNDAIKREALRQGRTISNYIANTIALSLGLPPEAVIAPNKRSPRKMISVDIIDANPRAKGVRNPDALTTVRISDSEARALAAEAKLAQLSALLGAQLAAPVPSVEARLDALGKIAKARPLSDRLNTMPDNKKSA